MMRTAIILSCRLVFIDTVQSSVYTMPSLSAFLRGFFVFLVPKFL
jgi:hypothetical protein